MAERKIIGLDSHHIHLNIKVIFKSSNSINITLLYMYNKLHFSYLLCA